MVTHLLMDKARPNRVAGAVGFSVRDGNFYVFRAKAVIVAAGGASHIYRPRAIGEGTGRTWYAPWSSASAYGLLVQAGARMIQMENKIVLARFKDGYGPVGAWFLLLKAMPQRLRRGISRWLEQTKGIVGEVCEHSRADCLRQSCDAGRSKGPGPHYMHTGRSIPARKRRSAGRISST
jgi:adenylylsulfate reductase subunit A